MTLAIDVGLGLRFVVKGVGRNLGYAGDSGDFHGPEAGVAPDRGAEGVASAAHLGGRDDGEGDQRGEEDAEEQAQGCEFDRALGHGARVSGRGRWWVVAAAKFKGKHAHRGLEGEEELEAGVSKANMNMGGVGWLIRVRVAGTARLGEANEFGRTSPTARAIAAAGGSRAVGDAYLLALPGHGGECHPPWRYQLVEIEPWQADGQEGTIGIQTASDFRGLRDLDPSRTLSQSLQRAAAPTTSKEVLTRSGT